MLGRLTWSAIPFDEPLPLLSGAVVGVVILATAKQYVLVDDVLRALIAVRQFWAARNERVLRPETYAHDHESGQRLPAGGCDHRVHQKTCSIVTGCGQGQLRVPASSQKGMR